MATNPDFKDLFAALSAEAAEFIVVGAHAVMLHTDRAATSWGHPARACTRRRSARIIATSRAPSSARIRATASTLARPVKHGMRSCCSASADEERSRHRHDRLSASEEGTAQAHRIAAEAVCVGLAVGLGKDRRGEHTLCNSEVFSGLRPSP